MKKNTQIEQETEIKPSAMDIIKSVLISTCVIFTSITMCLFIVHSIMDATGTQRYVKPERFLTLFPFALVISFANQVLKVKTMKNQTKSLIHYLIFGVAFYLFIFLPTGSETNDLAVLAVFSVIYWIIAGAILITLSVKAKKKAEKAPYESVYAASKNYKGKK